MRLSHEGLVLWYGTADAPAPEGVVEARHGVTVTVGVQPPHPSNVVTLRYRVDGGAHQSIPALELRTDYVHARQYFRATFPDFWAGEQVAYLPVLSCAGRQAPDPATARTLPSSFRLDAMPLTRLRGTTEAPPAPRPHGPQHNRYPFTLEYLATILIPLRTPEIIGVTPEGIKVNWFWAPAEGSLQGPRLNTRVRPMGGDWMTIRPDGIGIMGVRATLEADDGALIYTSYSGIFDLGEDGYHNFLHQRLPDSLPARSTPRFITAHPQYQWLNRLQCVGVGEAHLKELIYTYDLYSVC